MKIVFVSNYFNHHQRALSDGFYKYTNKQYYFIETEPMEAERSSMGWNVDELPPYVIQAHKSDVGKKRSIELINMADVVITGSASFEYVKERMRSGKLTFRYSERVLKTKKAYYQLPLRAIKYWYDGGRFKNVYMLCASAYAAADYSKVHCYRGKCFKWGYFPQTPIFENVKRVISEKELGSILWVARMIDWKHPEASILVAKRLKSNGIQFKLRIIGNGILEEQIKQKITNEHLDDCVEMLGAMPAAEVQEYMKKSQIFLATSDFNEGWGAVVNEAMGNACAVVASHAMGSVPFLISNGKNGFIYKNGDFDDLYQKVKKLLFDKELIANVALEAYNTIRHEWNGDVATRKYIRLVECIQNGEDPSGLLSRGVCSRAQYIDNEHF